MQGYLQIINVNAIVEDEYMKLCYFNPFTDCT